ncbi:DciA family protein [Corynebacterium uterequi]|uniref:Putative RNA-binding protein containing Zn ribbon n=1 Tax=Corynebacterium uterequi TaxID=1072256 RepID=A0A0G3HFU2_9CORY|nr:DciA family protein [Corynebacterium uterequi]AKK10037.1 putative RNA-binding protein containing Zn ribbon [Corynebacterium uterequi]
MSDEPEPVIDLVDLARHNLETVAKKRGVRLPQQPGGRVVVPRRSVPRPTLAGTTPTGTTPTVPGLDLPEREPVKSRREWMMAGPDGRRRRRPLEVPRFGTVVGREIRNRGWEKELAEGWVSSRWEELVGPQIAAHTRVEMIKEGTVFVTCSSTSWATNLKYMQAKILRTIAEKVGDGLITQLKFYGPKAPSWRKGPLHVKGRGPRDTYG